MTICRVYAASLRGFAGLAGVDAMLKNSSQYLSLNILYVQN